MKSNIEIKFLTLDQMENARNIDWRYEHVGMDNLGFADKLKNRVFVRAGLETELTKILIDHELSHLFEMEGTDEDEYGIRHKKKGGFMKVFLPIALSILGAILVPGVGGLLGGGLGSLLGGATGVGLGAGLGGVAGSSLTGKPNWLGNTIGGATAGLTAGALGGLTGGFGGSAGGGSSGSFSEVLGNGLNQSVNSQLANAGALTAGQATGSGIGQSIGALAGGAMGNLFTGALGQGQSAQGGFGPTSAGQSFKMPDLSQQQNANPSFSGWAQDTMIPEMAPQYGQSATQTSTGVGDMSGLVKMPMNPGLGQAGIALSGKSGFSGMDNMFNPQMDETGFNKMNGGNLAF